jgi:ComEC/Rec2-related protein
MYQAARGVHSLAICIRRAVPVLPLTIGVVIGETVAWYLNCEWKASALSIFGVLVLLLTRRWFGTVAAGTLLGLITASLVYGGREDIVPASDVSFQGIIRQEPRRATVGQVVFEIETLIAGRSALVRCRGIDLPWRNSAHLVAGATVWVRGAIEPVRKPLNPFSWEGWLWRRGVDAECKALFVSRPLAHNLDPRERARATLRERSYERTSNERGVALLLSMALGYRDVLSPALEQTFSTLGLTHLLVVSGYQVSMVFGVVIAIAVRGVPRNSSFRLWREGCAALGLLVASLYVVMIGAEMSAVRALIAAAFVCSQRLCESRGGFGQRWSVALLLMQILSPYCLFDVGVILTFAALAGIGIGATIGEKHTALTWLMVTVSVWVFTSLVVVAWSGSFSLLGVPLNLLLATPWSALNCTVGIVSLLGTLIGVPGMSSALDLVVWLNSAVSEVLMRIAQSPLAGCKLTGWYRWGTCATLCAISVALVNTAFVAKRRDV